MSRFSRADQSYLSRWWWTIDRPMLFMILSLAMIGLLLVATASPPVAEHLGLGSFHFFTRHAILLVPSIIGMIIASLMPPRMLWRISSLLFVLTLSAMVLVLISGDEVKGARRWMYIAGFSLQPSEFIKPLFAIVAAWFMAMHKTQGGIGGIAAAAGFYALTIALLMMQPDFGMSFVLTFIWCAQIFIAGLPLRYVAMLGGFLTACSGLVYLTFDHVRSRIDRFLSPETGDTFQIERSLRAFQEGGFMGKGPGQGTVKLSLPDAHADFVFSVAGEEMGALMALVIIVLFAVLLQRGFKRLGSQNDIFCVLAAGGILTMIGVQAFIHMGSALSVLPAKGMTLPF